VEPEFFGCYILNMSFAIELIVMFFVVFGVPLSALGFALFHAYSALRELSHPRWRAFLDSRGMLDSTVLNTRALASRRRFVVAMVILAMYLAVFLFLGAIAGPNCFDPPYCQEPITLGN
jgi:hypothetical protein